MLQALKKIPHTFGSPEFYVNFVRNAKGVGSGFIFIIVLLNLLPITINGAFNNKDVQEHILQIAEQLPSLELKNGKLGIDRPSPHIVFTENAKQERKNLLVFDTLWKSENITEIEKKLNDTNALFLVTDAWYATRSSSSNNELRIQHYDNKASNNFTLSHDEILSFAKKIIAFAPYAPLLLLIPLVGFIYIAVAVKAVLVIIAGTICQIDLDYTAAMRLTVIASIPINIISALLYLVRSTAHLGRASFLMWIAYVLYGLLCLKRAEGKKA